MNDSTPQDSDTQNSREHIVLDRVERRVLGVLVEKAKTTPDNYPLSLAALTTGCNQKSNRDPQMQLDEDEVDAAVTSLRLKGATTVVEGVGRVPKIRHNAYEFFDINGPQAAVLTELLLRGPQTAGELRARAGRMESFADLAALQEVLDQLIEKGHVQPLSPPGRGQTFAHTFYRPEEMPKVSEGAAEIRSSSSRRESGASDTADRLESLAAEVAELKERIEKLEQLLQ